MAFLKAFGAVVVGYGAMVILIMVSFSVAYMILGADRAFEPGSYHVSWTWLIMSFVVGFVTAIIGGFACALVAGRGSKAPLGLAVLVVALGAMTAIAAMNIAGDEEVREGDVPANEAMTKARQPVGALLGNPVIGFVGVLIGARLRGGRREQATSE
jgi:hypothetical protein